MCDIKKMLKLANNSIVLIDDYVDEQTFSVLEEKNENVELIICSKNRIMTCMKNIKRRKAFKEKIKFVESNEYRGRFILIDGKILFILSRSLRYNAKRNFYFIRIHDYEEINKVRMSVDNCLKRANELCRHF